MLKHLISKYKLDRGLIFKLSLKVIIGIPYNLTKDVKHFGFIKGEIVIIDTEFSLYLNLLIFKDKVYPIK